MTGAAESHLLLLYLLISLITCTTALYAPRIQATNEGAWERAVAKGTVLFQQLESGCYPDAVNPIDLEALRAIGFHIGNDAKSHWPPVFQETSAFPPGEARRFSWTTAQQAYWRTSVDRVYWVPWKDITRFHNEYSPRNGLIAALSARKAAAETLHWSDITFAMWQAVTTFTRRDIRNLRFIAHHAIHHAPTQTIIKRLIDGKIGESRTFGQRTEALFALLGTPGGAGTVYLLMQHKRQLGRKQIIRATVFGKVPSQWEHFGYGPDVVFEVRDKVDGAANVTNLGRACGSLGNETVSQL
ncbi:MAG: hypothetical protein LQ337_005956 [Flavoplaca oasis]|nr:MAG: hypothetical protein LQ337_005956 [Flavoplaca oasis]